MRRACGSRRIPRSRWRKATAPSTSGARRTTGASAFTGNTMGQVLLHYVVAGGPYAADYFDGNPHRFPPSISEGLI